MPAGRPTNYNEAILEKARDYLDNWQNIFPADGDVIPTVEGLALYLGIARSTLYLWAKDEDKQDFSDIFGRILEKQAKILVTKGLDGKFSPVITKVMLTKHNYREGVESDITSGGKPLEKGLINIIDKVYADSDKGHTSDSKDAGDSQSG